MSEHKEFKAESRRLLDLMINSIYTHKEIFLRELISNASDALDKYYLETLKDHRIPEPLKIKVDVNDEARTLTLSDNGIGMSREELEENLGTIAKSGSLAFKEELKKAQEKKDGTASAAADGQETDDGNLTLKDDVDIIGQFGVGFYSAFMVASNVTVVSKAYGSDEAWSWSSNGTDGYTIEPADREGHGTTVILKLKNDDENETYTKYLESYTISDLVKKYSDYIRYPIEMEVKTQKMIESTAENETPEFEEVTETRTLNSMVPLWKKKKSEISQEEFDQFYMDHFGSFTKPLDTIFFSIEGTVSYTALLFIPSRRPDNFYSRAYKPGLQLYSRGVMIEDRCESLLPDYLRFVQGLVDSQDLSLNISREMLQHDRQLRVIKKRIEKKVLSQLSSMLENNREDYESFWKNFGLDLKFGIYNSMGADKDKLENLLLFHTSNEGEMQTLKEFVASMPEEDKEIYYVSGVSAEAMAKLPTVAKLKSKGYPVLFLTDEIDEFVLQILQSYDGHDFRNASQGELDLDTEEQKQELKSQSEENQELLDFMKDALPEVSAVRLSSRLVDDPVMLVAGDGMSFEMERVFATMAAQAGDDLPPMKADRILEINPSSKIWAMLKTDFVSDKDKVKELAQVLYDQACLIEGFPIKDPIEYARMVTRLLTE